MWFGGGEWSGVYVYTANVDETLSVAIGDVLNITGEVVEFYDLTELKIGSAADIEMQGTSAEPVAFEIEVPQLRQIQQVGSSQVLVVNLIVLAVEVSQFLHLENAIS